jgi:Uma2 family endonuclease
MSVAVVSPPSPVAAPGPRRWTREEFYRLAELGFFAGQRAERIEGEIMVQSPQNWPHTAATTRTYEALRAVFGPGFWVRMQFPFAFGLGSDPEPDVSVVRGRFEDFTGHPTAAVLVVEVSDTTLTTDRTRKMSLYAAAGVPDYWIVNLIDGRLEVHRDPVPDATQPSGHRYAAVATLSPADAVTPAALPGVAVPVAALLP